MISFKQFITEEQSFDIEKFKKDCAFFLKQSKGQILWHGSRTGPTDFEIRNWRPRTGPKNSPNNLHNSVNEFMKERFGVDARNWMFVTGWKGDAEIYSGVQIGETAIRRPTYMIFPIGQFEWLSSSHEDLRDMTSWHTRVGMEIADATKKELSRDEQDNLATSHILRKITNVKWNHNTNLAQCIKSHNEIMIKCDKFYMINEHSDTAKQIKTFLSQVK